MGQTSFLVILILISVCCCQLLNGKISKHEDGVERNVDGRSNQRSDIKDETNDASTRLKDQKYFSTDENLTIKNERKTKENQAISIERFSDHRTSLEFQTGQLVNLSIITRPWRGNRRLGRKFSSFPKEANIFFIKDIPDFPKRMEIENGAINSKSLSKRSVDDVQVNTTNETKEEKYKHDGAIREKTANHIPPLSIENITNMQSNVRENLDSLTYDNKTDFITQMPDIANTSTESDFLESHINSTTDIPVSFIEDNDELTEISAKLSPSIDSEAKPNSSIVYGNGSNDSGSEQLPNEILFTKNTSTNNRNDNDLLSSQTDFPSAKNNSHNNLLDQENPLNGAGTDVEKVSFLNETTENTGKNHSIISPTESQNISQRISKSKVSDQNKSLLLELYKENIILKALVHHIASEVNLNNSMISDIGIDLETNQPEFNLTISENNTSSVFHDEALLNDTTRTVTPIRVNMNESETFPDDDYYNYDYSYDYDHVLVDAAEATAFTSKPLPVPAKIFEPKFDPNLASTVRKCCEKMQYFNIGAQGCIDIEEPSDIKSYIDSLLVDQNNETLDIVSGVLKCPNPADPPQLVHDVSSNSHVIDRGHLYDIENSLHYNHDLYCLELIGDHVTNASLVAAFCQENNQVIPISSVRKCCPVDQYFDALESKCIPGEDGKSMLPHLLKEFGSSYSNETIVETGTLACQQGNPELAEADAVHFTSSDQVCVSPTDRCFPTSLYCVEYVSLSENLPLKPTVAYCPLDSFQKCCPTHEFMFEGDCLGVDELHSPYLNQLMATLHYKIGHPIVDPRDCVHLVMNEEIRWYVTNSGYLTIDVGKEIIETKDYCIDDWIERDREINTGAYVCSRELKDNVRLPHSMFEKGTIGKCCSPSHHLSPEELRCVPGNSENNLKSDPQVINANISKIGYTGTPDCPKYHAYSFSKVMDDDYVEFDAMSRLNVISLDGKCIEKINSIEGDSYCIDYGWDAENSEILTAIVCIPEWTGTKLHTEKYDLVAALLGVSCFSLLVTLITLSMMRVRRGLVSTRKSNTLAGKILISYVVAHLVGFLTLALSMHIDVEDNTTACLILAGVMQFFLLAGFFWNTSICSESLFLTIRVKVPEKRRFIYHSLFAWGIPALLTALCLLIDVFRRDLPCGTITPKIGRVKCFFSDPDAELVYFYLPIAFTLVANLILLLTSRSARLSKLKKLEKSAPRAPHMQSNGSASKKTSVKGLHHSNSSGLRTHQNRNLVSESLRLVLWSGGTWLFEVVGFITARYISPPQENWYDYLWYIPATINSLRGFGIFFILVFSQENRQKIFRILGSVTGTSNKNNFNSTFKQSRNSSSNRMNSRIMSVSVNNSSSYHDMRLNGKQRNMSIATTVTSIPTCQGQNSIDHPPHNRLVKSVSQINMDRRPSTTSSIGSLSEDEDLECEIVIPGNIAPNVIPMNGVRKKSMAVPNSLPSVDEEEDCMNVNLSSSTTP